MQIGSQNEAKCFTQLAGNVGAVVGSQIEHRRVVTSTMDIAHQMALAGAPEGVTIIADHQTVGRGRKNRVWNDSPKDDLALSIVLYPTTQSAGLMFIMVALAIADCITPWVKAKPLFKWPNDVLVEGRKIAGVIVDTTQQDTNFLTVIGIGLNVNMDTAHEAVRNYNATSIRLIRHGSKVSRCAVLSDLLQALDRCYAMMKRGENIIAKWQECLIDIGKTVEVVRDGVVVHTGVVSSVDSVGRLVVRGADDELFAAVAEEVNIVRQ